MCPLELLHCALFMPNLSIAGLPYCYVKDSSNYRLNLTQLLPRTIHFPYFAMFEHLDRNQVASQRIGWPCLMSKNLLFSFLYNTTGL